MIYASSALHSHNFLLTHASCNERNSDRLPAALHLDAWVEQNQSLGREKGHEFEREGVIHDLSTSARIMDWAYRQTSEFNGLTWLRAKELEPLPAGLHSILDRPPQDKPESSENAHKTRVFCMFAAP